MRDDSSPPPSTPGQPDRLDELLRPPRRPSGPLERVPDRWRARRGRPRRGRSKGGPSTTAVAAVIVVGLAVGGLWWWNARRPGVSFDLAALPRAGTSTPSATGGSGAPAEPSSATGPAPGPASGPASGPSAVTVDVAGAVVEPGIRRLSPGSRVADAIEAAGGARPGADLDRVNRAAALVDGARVWIPTRGQPDPSPVAVEPPSATSGSGSGGTPAAPVDLNTATVEQLDTLPGVGPATAGAIVAYRGLHGRFETVDQLGDVRGIGAAKLETLRPLVRVGS